MVAEDKPIEVSRYRPSVVRVSIARQMRSPGIIIIGRYMYTIMTEPADKTCKQPSAPAKLCMDLALYITKIHDLA